MRNDGGLRSVSEDEVHHLDPVRVVLMDEREDEERNARTTDDVRGSRREEMFDEALVVGSDSEEDERESFVTDLYGSLVDLAAESQEASVIAEKRGR